MKFYYKQGDSVDEIPIMERLEHRRAMNGNNDELEEELTPTSTRIPSVNSVDRPKNESTKAKNRDVSKSLSEDIMNREHVKNSMVITENELESSHLYKVRRDSMMCKDCRQHTGLSPVELKDPKLKPIIVNPNSRSNNSSCLCYLAITMAICVCTVGLLGIITGFIYKEMFSEKNSTSPHESESLFEISNLIPESLSSDVSIARKVLTAGHEALQRSLGNIDTTSKSVVPEEMTEKVQPASFRQLNVSHLSQFLDTKKAEIKFQDGNTIIYEMNSGSSLEHENDSRVLDDSKTKEIGSHEDERTENKASDNEAPESDTDSENLETFINPHVMSRSLFAGSKMNPQISDNTFQDEIVDDTMTTESKVEIEPESVSLKPIKTYKSGKTVIQPDSDPDVKESFFEEHMPSINLDHIWIGDNHNMKSKNLDLSVNENFLKQSNNGESSLIENGDLNEQIKESERDVEPKLMTANETEKEKLGVISPTDDISSSEISNSREGSNSGEISKVNGSIINEQNPISLRTEHETKLGKVPESEEHDIDSMLEVVNEPEESLVTVISSRNGDIRPFTETLSSTLRTNQNFMLKKEGMNPVIQITQVTTEPLYFQDQLMSTEHSLRTKQLDMKFQLAEAMKHLQSLDASNKHLTARMKPNVGKPSNKKQPESSTKFRSKENNSKEKLQYLQNLRLMLQDNFQRL